jgi:shikimate kinase
MLIFLIGFAGSGKTYWGERWAEVLNLKHYDVDQVIEQEHGQSVVDIFETQGEQHFRALEKDTLQQFLQGDNMLISCGGGLPCYFKNMEQMNAAGTTIYLQADPDFLYERLLSGIDDRPLLKKIHPSEVLTFIKKKLREREPFYKRARYTVDASSLTSHTLNEVLANES